MLYRVVQLLQMTLPEFLLITEESIVSITLVKVRLRLLALESRWSVHPNKKTLKTSYNNTLLHTRISVEEYVYGYSYTRFNIF